MFSIRRLFQGKSAPSPNVAGRREYDFKTSDFYSDLEDAEDKVAFIRSLNYTVMPPDKFENLCLDLLTTTIPGLEKIQAYKLLEEVLLKVRPTPEEEAKFQESAKRFSDSLRADPDVMAYLQSPDNEKNSAQSFAGKVQEIYGNAFHAEIEDPVLVSEVDANDDHSSYPGTRGRFVKETQDKGVFLSRIIAACTRAHYIYLSENAYTVAIKIAERHHNKMTAATTPAQFSDSISMPFIDRVMALTAMTCDNLSLPQPSLSKDLWDHYLKQRFYRGENSPQSLEDIANVVTEMNEAPGPIHMQGHIFLRAIGKLLPEEVKGKKGKDYRLYNAGIPVPDIQIAGDVDCEAGSEFKERIERAWILHVPPAIRELITQRPLEIEICRFKGSDDRSLAEKNSINTNTAGGYDKYKNKVRIFTHTVKEGVEYPIPANDVAHTFLHELVHATAKIFYGITNAEESGLKKNYIRDINTLKERGWGEHVPEFSYNLPKSHGGDHESLDVACEEAFCDSVAASLGFASGYEVLKQALPNFQNSVETFIATMDVMHDVGLKRDDVTFGGRISRESSGYTEEQLDRDKAQAAQRIEFAMMGGPVFFG